MSEAIELLRKYETLLALVVTEPKPVSGWTVEEQEQVDDYWVDVFQARLHNPAVREAWENYLEANPNH